VRVEIVFATRTDQHRDRIEAEEGITIGEAIRRSALVWALEEAAEASPQVGVFGRLRLLSDPVLDGDRIEIYRGLMADPKVSRRRRARGQRRIKGGAYRG
jgi:putative ubiquitin-RnfH superfamily antitoxin RatB of RatAB toxin-antitoxin module